jgi:hypothetical protein
METKMTTFFELVAAVEENNRINDGQWHHFSEGDDHIEQAYGNLNEDENKLVARAFLSALVRDNGENLQIYKDAMQCLEYGQAFSPN